MHLAISAAGMSIAGQVFVEDHAVRVDIPLPWPLAMLGKSLKQQIEQEGQKLLSGRSKSANTS
jgi:hypothetical protein